MTDIIDMACEAGISDAYFDFQMVSPSDLERFARIVAKHERDRCASIARQMNCPSVAGAIEGDGK